MKAKSAPAPLDRSAPFWERCFCIAFETLARREAQSGHVLPGPKLARAARLLADDCERVRSADDQADACPECGGPGCPACRYTGKSDAGEGLRAPAAPVPTIPIEAPPAVDVSGEAPARTCLCPDWPRAWGAACPIHGTAAEGDGAAEVRS
jgi:hypothetical protein